MHQIFHRTLLNFSPYTCLMVLTINMARFIKRYWMIRIFKWVSKALNHQGHLGFMQIYLLPTPVLTSVGLLWQSSMRNSFHVHSLLAKNLIHTWMTTQAFLCQDSIQALCPRQNTPHQIFLSQVATSANYCGVWWILGFAQCVSSQYGFMLTLR